MSQHFSNKVVLITGAASGFGAEIAQQFSNLRAKLSLVDRNWEQLQNTKEKFANNGEENLLLIKADLTNDNEVEQVIDKTIKKFGNLDILVNNAGILDIGTVKTTSLEQYDKTFDINCRAVFYLTQLAVPHLKATKGSIINISSIATDIIFPSALAYSLTKAAINHFTEHLALGLGPKGVRVNSVNPGVIHTNIFKNAGMTDDVIDKELNNFASNNPLGRLGKVEDVAKAVIFLASDDANFITGVHLAVDGGQRLKSISK